MINTLDCAEYQHKSSSQSPMGFEILFCFNIYSSSEVKTLTGLLPQAQKLTMLREDFNTFFQNEPCPKTVQQILFSLYSFLHSLVHMRDWIFKGSRFITELQAGKVLSLNKYEDEK